MFGGPQSSPTRPITKKLALDTSRDSLIQKFWDIESYGIKPKDVINIMTVNDKRAMEILQKTTTKYGNHYAVGLLCKEDNVTLPNNKPLAISKLYNLEKKFGKEQKIKQMYTETMNDEIAKGYALQLSKSEVKSS